MTRRFASAARGVGALLLLVAILILPPTLLTVFVGWPLPRSLPNSGAVESALRTGVDDAVVVKALAVLAWIAWAQVALAIATEVIAAVARRPSRRLPIFPGLQAVVARLVASIAMITGALPATMAMAAPPTLHVAGATSPPIVVEATLGLDLYESEHDVSIEHEPAPETPTILVQRHDSYWSIAERVLGDGFRWREIRDQNIGHTMNTGYVIEPDSDLLRPGWILELPIDAVVEAALDYPAPDPTVEASPGLPEVTVQEGDNFWVIAERTVSTDAEPHPTDADIVPYWHALIDANRDRLADVANPNLIYPGQRLQLPPHSNGHREAAPAPEALEIETPMEGSELDPQDRSTLPPDAHGRPAPGSRTSNDGMNVDPSESNSGSIAPVVVTGLASTAFAVGAVAAIRRRRRRAAHHHATSGPETIDGDDRRVLAELVVDADQLAIEELRSALHVLAQDIAQNGTDARPRVVQHAVGRIEVVLDRPEVAAPKGWNAVGDGLVWTRTLEEPNRTGDETRNVAPLLVAFGVPDDGGQLYIDLEAHTALSLTGEPARARALARTMLSELLLSPFAPALEVIVIGNIAPSRTAELGHLIRADSWDEVASDVIAFAEQSHEAISAHAETWPNTFVARHRFPDHDALVPVVVIADQPPPPEWRAALLAHRPSAIGIIVLGDLPGATTVICTESELTIPDLGLACVPRVLDPETVDIVADLVTGEPNESRADPEPEDVADLLGVEPEELSPSQPSLPGVEDADQSEYQVLVRVLGDMTVDGAESLTAKQAATLTYIALHRKVSAERLEDALWAAPANGSRRKRLANTISECRAVVGREILPVAADGHYRAGPGITTDADLFEHRVRRAQDEPAEEAIETLRSALDLVTGPPFTYRRADRASFVWVDVENWTSMWETKITNVAGHCAGMLLRHDRADDATTVARRALRIVPTHTELTEVLMRAHAAAGNRQAVQSVYDEHVNALRELDLDDPAESTTELFSRLVRPTPA